MGEPDCVDSFNQYFQRKFGAYKADKYFRDDGMHIELLRLASFKNWPRSSPIMPNHLAREGLFYTGQDDEVSCYSCGCRLKDWNRGENPSDRHREQNPYCSIITGTDKISNVSLPRKEDIIESSLQVFEHNKETDLQGAVGGAIENVSYQSGSRLTDPYQEPPQTTQALSMPNKPSSFDPIPDTRHPLSVPVNVNLPDYKIEHIRRQTFQTWPETSYVSPDDVCKAGFISIGLGEQVQCVFCKGVIKAWSPGDIPFNEHERLFPDCPFVKNPRIGRNPLPPPTKTRKEEEESKQMDTLHELGIETDLPKVHAMAIEQSRLETFKKWSMRTQRPAVLAKAGFFYTGTADCVKCYWCGGGLKNWLPADDPWVEHVKFFPNCGHLKRTVGEDFICYVKEHKKAPADHVTTRVEPDELQKRMDSPLVRNVLSMGFDRSFVEKIIHYRMATYGDDFENEQILVEAILRFMERPPVDFPLPISNLQNSDSSQSLEHNAQRDDDTDSDEEMDTEGPDDNTKTIHGSSKAECRVCMANEVNQLFLPCGHVVTCKNCAPALKLCPLCRGQIKGTVNVIIN